MTSTDNSKNSHTNNHITRKVPSYFNNNIFAAVFPSLLLLIFGLAWILINKPLLENIQTISTTNVPLMGTQVSADKNNLIQIANQLSTIEANQKTPTITPSPTLQSGKYNRWKVTTINGFDVDVHFSADYSNFKLVADKTKTDIGFIYTPINDIHNLSFIIKLDQIPHLQDLYIKDNDTNINYRILIGVTDKFIIENNANIDNYVQIKIYPTYVKTEYLWYCCKVTGESDILSTPQITSNIRPISSQAGNTFEVLVEDGEIWLILGDERLAIPFAISNFTEPVLYVGYSQSNKCGDYCPVNFSISDIKYELIEINSSQN